MSDHKEYDWNPYSLSPEMLEAIGLVTTAYAQTETVLQDALAGCARLDFMCGRAITTHMPMPLRFDVLRTLAEITIDDVHLLDELDDHLEQLDLAIKKRNAVAHNKWCIDPSTKETFTVKDSARGSLRMDLVPTTVDQIRADAKFIYEVGMKLFVFLNMHGFMPRVVEWPNRFHKTKAERRKRRKQP